MADPKCPDCDNPHFAPHSVTCPRYTPDVHRVDGLTVADPVTPEARVRELLAEVYLPEGVEIWLNNHNRNLGMERAIDLIQAGRGEEVLAEVERLVGGAW